MKKTLPTLLGALLICATPCPAQSWSSRLSPVSGLAAFTHTTPQSPYRVWQSYTALSAASVTTQAVLRQGCSRFSAPR